MLLGGFQFHRIGGGLDWKSKPQRANQKRSHRIEQPSPSFRVRDVFRMGEFRKIYDQRLTWDNIKDSHHMIKHRLDWIYVGDAIPSLPLTKGQMRLWFSINTKACKWTTLRGVWHGQCPSSNLLDVAFVLAWLGLSGYWLWSINRFFFKFLIVVGLLRAFVKPSTNFGILFTHVQIIQHWFMLVNP